MDYSDLKNEVEKIKWFHRIDFGNGIVTPGVDFSSEKLKTIKMSDSLQGLTVLDIGAWDGFFSFEAERRGAKRVLALDSFCWGGAGWGTKDGFELVRKAFNSKVEDLTLDVNEISPEKIGVFDLVLFLGVLYHMRHPLLILERVSSVVKKQLILETHVDLLHCKYPAMKFYPGSELGQDPTNWWGPNPAAVISMLKDVGFSKVEIVSYPAYFFIRLAKTAYRKLLKNEPFFSNLNIARMVFHAWK